MEFNNKLYELRKQKGFSQEELASMTSAGAIALHYGIPMKVIEAKVINLKITYQNDMVTLKELMHMYFPDQYKEK